MNLLNYLFYDIKYYDSMIPNIMVLCIIIHYMYNSTYPYCMHVGIVHSTYMVCTIKYPKYVDIMNI